jgi:hypothetical protein
MKKTTTKTHRKCWRCKKTKPLDTGFYKNKSESRGYAYLCKKCSDDDYKLRYEKNWYKFKQYKKDWYEKNRDKVIEKSAEWRELNREKRKKIRNEYVRGKHAEKL